MSATLPDHADPEGSLRRPDHRPDAYPPGTRPDEADPARVTPELVVALRRDPRTGEALAPVPGNDPRRADAALTSARRAWVMWRRTPQAERSSTLRELAGAVESAAHELAELNSRETGRLFNDALAGVWAGAEALRRYAELSLLRTGPSLAGAFSGLDFTVFEPRGVVLGLTSWDDPVAVSCAIVGAGLAAGNTVLLKPSERCPALGRRLGWLFSSAVPTGVVGSVIGDGTLGAALARDDRVDAVVHVGSWAVADSLEAGCRGGAHLVRGRAGNGVVIVDRGVDLGWAAACVADAAFRHAGQLRSAAGRIYVMDDVADDFLAALVDQACEWTGEDRLGPLVDSRAREKVHGIITRAIADGATPVCGAEIPDGPGCYYPPTVLTGAPSTMDVLTQELRGPVAAVMGVQSFDEALAEAAEAPCGASATVLTCDIAHAQIAAAELPVATVVVNGLAQGATGTDAPGLPQTGSPVGFGPRLLDELSRPKVIHLEPPVMARPGHGR